MQEKRRTEMVKLNRIKYAYSEEEMQNLIKEGYTPTHAEAELPEDDKPAEKRGTKKK